MMTDLLDRKHHQECDAAFELFQKAVAVFQALPTEENKNIAFDLHRKWQDLFLTLPRLRRLPEQSHAVPAVGIKQ